MKKTKNFIAYAMLFLFSILFIYIGNRVATRNAMIFTASVGTPKEWYVVKIDMILKEEETEIDFGGTSLLQTTRDFSGTVVYGEKKGEGLIGQQKYDTAAGRAPTPLRPGDWAIVYKNADTETYFSGEIVRINSIILVAAAFFLLLIVFGRMKGVAMILSLLLSVLSIFLVFIPAILSGFNVYVWAIIICVFSIVITPYFVGGFNIKSLSSMLGSLVSVALASGLTAVLNALMRITGGVDDETMQVAYILDRPIDLRAIVFAAVIIGALGATLDVSMSIASSISEMKDVTGDSSFRSLFRTGVNIGRDIMGAQTSTLVMAYIGGSLSVVLLLIAYQNSLYELLNIEYVIIELLQALVGGFTILFAIPGTALIAALLFSRRTWVKEKEQEVIPYL